VINLLSLVAQVRGSGGILTLDGDTVRYRLPQDAVHLVGELKAHKAELVELLRRESTKTTFPHCPQCASYDLYRENNIGAYECQSCGLQNIEEQSARRLM
jgi:hypothetical protein